MNTIEQAQEVSNRLRTITGSVDKNAFFIAADTIDVLIAENERLTAAVELGRAQNDVEVTQSKNYEGKLYTVANELRKLKHHSRNVVEQKLNEALTVTAERDGITHELEEQLRLNSIGAEREYVLLGKVAQLERERDDLRAELEKIKDNETELPEPFFGIGRYLCIAGTRDAYTKDQLRNYGDKRAAHARKAALEALQLPSMKTESMLAQNDQAIAAIQEILK